MPNAYTLHRQRQSGKKPSIAKTTQKVRVGPGGGRRIRKVGNETIDVATPAKVIGAAELQKSIELKDKEIEALKENLKTANSMNEELIDSLDTAKTELAKYKDQSKQSTEEPNKSKKK